MGCVFLFRLMALFISNCLTNSYYLISYVLCCISSRLQRTGEAEMALREESSCRLADMERKLQQAVREKEALKTSLHDTESEMSRR